MEKCDFPERGEDWALRWGGGDRVPPGLLLTPHLGFGSGCGPGSGSGPFFALEPSLPSKVSSGSRKSRKAIGRCLGFLPCVCVSCSVVTLCDPVDCSPPGSSVHRILQARILGWVAIPFSRGPSRPKDGTQVSCIAGRFFTV